VENLCGSVLCDLDSSTFTAYENTVGVSSAQWFYEKCAESQKLRWSIKVLKMEVEGLNLGAQVNDQPGKGSVRVLKNLAGN
jgi:hypothetical protein